MSGCNKPPMIGAALAGRKRGLWGFSGVGLSLRARPGSAEHHARRPYQNRITRRMFE